MCLFLVPSVFLRLAHLDSSRFVKDPLQVFHLIEILYCRYVLSVWQYAADFLLRGLERP